MATAASIKAFLRKRKAMLRVVQYAMGWSLAFGFDGVKLILGIRGLPVVVREYFSLKVQNRRAGRKWKIRFTSPCLDDRFAESGATSGHYFQQDLLVARKVFARKPERHVDVGSRVDGFVAHVAAFRPIEVFDIRPLTAKVANVTFVRCDLMRLPREFEACCDSLSCLHAVEHFGLGRYGDPIDIDGHVRGLEGFWKMLKRGGLLYLSFAIGTDAIEFNGQRIFSMRTVLDLTKGWFELVGFSFIDDAGEVHEDVCLDEAAIANNLCQANGCGIFELRKIEPREAA